MDNRYYYKGLYRTTNGIHSPIPSSAPGSHSCVIYNVNTKLKRRLANLWYLHACMLDPLEHPLAFLLRIECASCWRSCAERGRGSPAAVKQAFSAGELL